MRLPGLDAALARLLRLKLRGWRRRAGRRLRTPSGLAFAILGLVILAAWGASVALPLRSGALGAPDPAAAEALARTMLAMLALMSVLGSLTHRGLYLPRDEVERLLSAPLPRRDLVRYRTLSNLGRSLLFAPVLGLLLGARMPRLVFGMAGTGLAVLALPVLGQLTALVFGDAETRLGKLARRLPAGALRAATLLPFLLFALLAMGGGMLGEEAGELVPPGAGELGEGAAPLAWIGRLGERPLVRLATLPFAPWSRAAAASDAAAFWPAFALALLCTLLLFEVTARLPVDFRELALETSAAVSARLDALRSGRGMVSGTQVSERARRRRVPWLLGRGPFGAVAWVKLAAIGRRARGTLFFALLVTALATGLSLELLEEPVGGALFVALLGTVYLASGLRYDFRGDLDLMETVKAWPVTPWRVFLASLLPEVGLISVLVGAAVAVRSVVLGSFAPGVAVVLLCTPLVGLLWLAVDNAVFLLVPVRFVPGQASALHHTGRTLVLLLLRTLLAGGLALACAGAAWGAWAGGRALGLGPGGAGALAALAALLVTGAVLVGVVGFGGWALGRYDVARQAGLVD